MCVNKAVFGGKKIREKEDVWHKGVVRGFKVVDDSTVDEKALAWVEDEFLGSGIADHGSF